MISNSLNNISAWWHKDDSYLSSEPHSDSKRLQSAIDVNSILDVKNLLRSDLAEEPLPNGEQPLNYAIRKGRVAIVDLIASNYPKTLEECDHHGLTALNHALISKNPKILKIVFDNKFKVDSEISDYLAYPLEKAISFSKLVFQRSIGETLIRSYDDTINQNFEAAETGNLEFFKNSLKSDLDVNATTYYGWSLLHLAAKSGNADLVKLLIENGAKADTFTVGHHLSPLHLAAMGNNSRMMGYLITAGTDINAIDEEGSTALHYAMTKDSLFSAQFLIEKGAEYAKKNQLGVTPLSVMLALARSQSSNKDELTLSALDYMMFGGVVASILSAYYQENIPLELLSFATANIAPILMSCKNKKNLLDGLKSIVIALGLNLIPGANLISQASRVLMLAKKALQGIETSLKYRHLETARPIRNAVVLGVNAAYSANIFWKTFKFTLKETRAIYELINASKKESKAFEYAFEREKASDVNIQNKTKAREVFETIQKTHNQTNIIFNENSLYPFDDAGTCSAMTLDFVSRMQNECVKLIDSEKFINCVKDKGLYYKSNTEEFSSVQSAFNTISVVDNTFQVSSEMLAAQKMQSLASYHNMTLTPVTRTLLRSENMEKVIEMLPEGSYIVRLLHPSGSHKLEHYGHTMGFIKRDDKSIFYDNSKGARIIDGNVTSAVLENLNNWPYIPTIRIYKSECPSEGCNNLSINK